MARRSAPLLEGFGLDADITVSELREESVLSERLLAFHRLRVRRRNDVLGVLVDADTWREIAAYVRSLEDELDTFEEQAVRSIVAERVPGAKFVPATPEVISEIDRQYQNLIKGD